MQRDQRDAVLLAVTTPGALCRASVRYLDGRELGLPSQKAIRQGLVVWVWHESTSGAGGVADVTCSLDGATASATAGFRVQR